jgi:arsenate reductase-like glutaredoxin family protein
MTKQSVRIYHNPRCSKRAAIGRPPENVLEILPK